MGKAITVKLNEAKESLHGSLKENQAKLLWTVIGRAQPASWAAARNEMKTALTARKEPE